MGRGRGKAKKMTANNHEDPESGEEERIPAQKRRGRPHKPVQDEMDEGETEKVEEEDDDRLKSAVSDDGKGLVAAENGKKRKRYAQAKEKLDSMKEENGDETNPREDASPKPNGFRPHRSRRKNKPCRAAEAGVDCI